MANPVLRPAARACAPNQIEAPRVIGAAAINNAAMPIAPITIPAQPTTPPPQHPPFFQCLKIS